MTNSADRGQHRTGSRPGWPQLLETLHTAGAEAGRTEADWWAQNTVGGRATGDTAATARRVLAGIDDGDPAVLDSLPTLSAGDDAQRHRDAVPAAAPDFAQLSATERAAAADAYRDGFDIAVTDAVTVHCRAATSPTGDGRDLSHLHPDNLRIGRVGVFSGDWAWTIGADGTDRIPVGYVGTLIDTWNGWAVFSCTRPVAEAIVAEQQRQRRDHRDTLLTQGEPEADVDRQVDEALTNLRFDGEIIVADQRAQSDDPEAIERITPDRDGRYVVMGWNWCWEAVDPYACDRIVGDLPDVDCRQHFVVLTHTGLRVPHDRLTVTALQQTPTHNGTAYTAEVSLDGAVVGRIRNDGNGGATELYAAHPQFGWREMAAYVADCRRHGRPATGEQVLDALVTEYEVDQAIRDAAATGAALARLVDADGTIVHLKQVDPIPRQIAAQVEVGRLLSREHPGGQAWQLWSRTAWWHLSTVTPTSPTATGRSEPPAQP
jgi:hypothetical protein